MFEQVYLTVDGVQIGATNLRLSRSESNRNKEGNLHCPKFQDWSSNIKSVEYHIQRTPAQ